MRLCLWMAENSAWHCPHSLNVSPYCHYLTFSQPGTLPSPCGDEFHSQWSDWENRRKRLPGRPGGGELCVCLGAKMAPLFPSSFPLMSSRVTLCLQQLGTIVLGWKGWWWKEIFFPWPRDSWWFSPFCNDVFTSGWNSAYPRRGERIQVKRVLVSFSGGFGTPLSS